MPALAGTPSDDVPEILATGRTDVTAIFVSMSSRHPEGRDADYLAWHSLDHRPEQYRLAGLRASLRVASTPACRAARAVSAARYDALDHVMTYFFADVAGLPDFAALGAAIKDAGRTPYLLPLVERGVYRLTGTRAAPRIKAGADVLPWWPATGVYLLVERGEAPASDLAEVAGVGGAWWAAGVAVEAPYASADTRGLQITYCFLDGDPVETAARLRPCLEKRWADGGVRPLLAAPFRTIVPYEWDRVVP
ncbi:MAG TPA: hypothetical protein VKH41_14645 [Myxococcota bacterium]|nr:hypothetical protein [Myxococcota bacterium]